MNKKELREKKLGFEEDTDLYEFFKTSINKKPMGYARVHLHKNGRRMGKLYWEEIRLVYGSPTATKPFLEIKTLNGFKLIIFRNEFRIRPYEQMEDNCYLSGFPEFNTIEFYMEFEWTINIEELRSR